MAVAIFGCGPAGLFAAQAVTLRGLEPVIISRKQKSVIYGAQYLHMPIPELSHPKPDGYIKTIRLGTPEGYAERVYGDGQTLTSWQKVQSGPVPAWDLRATYDAAWDKFEDQIVDDVLDARSAEEFSAIHDLVISTIPIWSICLKTQRHRFKSIPIVVKKQMEYTGLPDVWSHQLGGVVYNGTEYGTWYRTSYIFGHESTEARPNSIFEPTEGWDIGFKVAGTTCDCHPNIVRAGRMGMWERGVLTHNAFETALGVIDERTVRTV